MTMPLPNMRLTLLALVLSACVGVSYQRPGRHLTPRAGQTLVFGRLRFFHDEREFFPWGAAPAGTSTERHVWLLRLGARAVSAELHPEEDGSIAICLAGGDYALMGSTQLLTWGSAAYEVVALFRVPAGGAAYAGELILKTESYEGWHVSYSEFGASSVAVLPIDTARAVLERKIGTLPQPPVLYPWCAGDFLPAFNDSKLTSRATELLDRGCPDAG